MFCNNVFLNMYRILNLSYNVCWNRPLDLINKLTTMCYEVCVYIKLNNKLHELKYPSIHLGILFHCFWISQLVSYKEIFQKAWYHNYREFSSFYDQFKDKIGKLPFWIIFFLKPKQHDVKYCFFFSSWVNILN